MSAGGFVTSAQLAMARLGFRCNLKSAEGIIHEAVRWAPEGTRFSFGAGAVCDTQMPPGLPFATANFAPSADEATACQKPVTLFDAHVAPELVLNQIRSCSTAANLTASAEEATEVSRPTGA